MDFTESRQEHWENDEGIKHVTDTQQVTYNINHHVRVRLTTIGFDHWWRKRHNQFGTPFYMKEMSPEELDYVFSHHFAVEVNTHYVGNGWYEFQLWRLLGLFGELFTEGMGLHSPIPFETNIVLIERRLKLLEPVAQT